MAGGNVLVEDFQHGLDHIDLKGYGGKAIVNAVASEQHPSGSSTMITLSDGTTITFMGVTSLKVTDFH